jgi:hypothetical protein
VTWPPIPDQVVVRQVLNLRPLACERGTAGFGDLDLYSLNSYVVCVIAGGLPGDLIAPLTKSRAADTSSGGAGWRAEEVRYVKTRRAFAALMMTFLVLGMGVRAAGATPPIGNCPSAFDGPLTFEQIIAAYPPPPGTPDPIAVLAGFDKNGDRSLCVLDVPGDGVNVIDNVVRVPS